MIKKLKEKQPQLLENHLRCKSKDNKIISIHNFINHKKLLKLCKDKNFLIINTNILEQDGSLTFIRKVLEIINGKKIKPLLN